MANSQVEIDPADFTQPSYGAGYVALLILLALVTCATQFAATEIVWWSMSLNDAPFTAFPTSIPRLSPGCSAVWNNEVWVSVTDEPPNSGRLIKAGRASTSRVVAIDLQTGKSRETGIKLTPAPKGMLVVNGELWAVSEGTVCRIEDGQAIPRSPRRGLTQPTNPFVYQGQLAIIDRNHNGSFSLLTWQEGEWADQGRVDVPNISSVYTWAKPDLRVAMHGDQINLLYFNGQTVSFRVGLEVNGIEGPASAVYPENPRLVEYTLNQNPANPPPPVPSGWRSVPFTVNWDSELDFAFVQDRLWVIGLASTNSPSQLLQYSYASDQWSNQGLSQPLEAKSFSLAGADPGYIVTDDLRLFALGGTTATNKAVAPIRITESLRYVLTLSLVLSGSVLAMTILCLGAWILMLRKRKPHYVYGKREVVFASVLRRGIARAIDLSAVVLPSLYWLAVLVTIRANAQSFFGVGYENFVLFQLLSIFLLWLSSLVVVSVMEGIWGITPGKWLCGIRTLRTTLRPCGMLRSLTRELMIYVDSLFLLTWLPGILTIALTRHWQRLGDLVADTVVVIDPQASRNRD